MNYSELYSPEPKSELVVEPIGDQVFVLVDDEDNVLSDNGNSLTT